VFVGLTGQSLRCCGTLALRRDQLSELRLALVHFRSDLPDVDPQAYRKECSEQAIAPDEDHAIAPTTHGVTYRSHSSLVLALLLGRLELGLRPCFDPRSRDGGLLVVRRPRRFLFLPRLFPRSPLLFHGNALALGFQLESTLLVALSTLTFQSGHSLPLVGVNSVAFDVHEGPERK
jgi:hypothetical protein